MMNEENKVYCENEQCSFNGEEITMEEIYEKKKNLKNSERIVETNPGTFHLVERMQG